MKLSCLASGSTGNCYVLDNGKDILLLDAGVKAKNLFHAIHDFNRIAGCLVTHEHLDHAQAVPELLRLGISVFLSRGTYLSLPQIKTQNKANFVANKQIFKAGTYTITAFDIEHDATEPLGYLITDTLSKQTLLFVTDTWYLRYTFPNVNYWMIECNFIKDLAEAQFEDRERHPLWKRIRTSHMSLEMLKETLEANDLSKTYKILLIHLSDSRSDEKRMQEEIQALTSIETTVLTQGKEVILNPTDF